MAARLIRYTLDGVKLTHDIGFTATDGDGFDVYINRTKLDKDVDYDVIGSVDELRKGNGKITLKTAHAASDVLLILSDTLARRVTNFAQAARFEEAEIDNEFDNLLRLLEDAALNLQSTPYFSPPDIGLVNGELPALIAGGVLRVNALKNGFELVELDKVPEFLEALRKCTEQADRSESEADKSEASAQEAQAIADSIGQYRGLWPSAGGSAKKGDTWQTQASGVPTGRFYTALKDTTAAPSADNTNWKEMINKESLPAYTDITYRASGGKSAVDNMISDLNLNPLMYAIGTYIKTGGTTFEYIDSTGQITKDNFRALNAISARDFGVTGSGIDEREELQKAINAAEGRSLFLEDLNYIVSFDGMYGLVIPSNITIDANNATIQCESTDLTNYGIIYAYKKKNIVINNLNVIGDVETHTGTLGEAGYAFEVRSCENYTLNNCSGSKCWGDGLLLGSDSISTNNGVYINYCTFDSNRRQGSSVGGGVRVVYEGCTFKNTGSILSTEPSAGVDVEPDANKIADLDVKFSNCSFENNKGGAMHVILSGCLNAPTLVGGTCQVDVNFINCTSRNDDSYNTAEGRAAVRFGGTQATYPDPANGNKLQGGVNFVNLTISSPATSAIWLTNPIAAYPPLKFNGTTVSDVFSGIPLGAAMPVGNIIYFDIFDSVASNPNFEVGDIDFIGLTYRDTRGLTYSSTASDSNHRVKRPVWHKNLPENKSLKSVRFRHFKTEIQPDSLNFLMNGYRGDECNFDRDTIFVDRDTSITVAETQGRWGLGIVPVIGESGTASLVVEMPTTEDRQGTYQVVRSYRDSAATGQRLVFRACSVSGFAEEIIYLDGTRTGAQKEPAQSLGEFVFFCPKQGVWVQQ